MVEFDRSSVGVSVEIDWNGFEEECGRPDEVLLRTSWPRMQVITAVVCRSHSLL